MTSRSGALRRITHALPLSLLAVAFTVSGSIAADADGDGLRDGFERRHGVTSPAKADSDGDGVVDSAEDNDGDRLGNLGEQRFGTDPGRRDSDGDGVDDGAEDHDGDGRRNALEQDQRAVPADLRPSLAQAQSQRGRVSRGCYATWGSSRLVRCRFGPKRSGTRIVLVGDSHARMLLGPMKRAAQVEGWRLISMLKTSCIPVPGIMSAGRHAFDRGHSCRTWRKRMVAAIRANPPDLVVITANAKYKLVDDRGRPLPSSRRPAAWREGLERLLARMPRSTEVLYLGDVPPNRIDPVTCLKRHRDDMSRCVTPRRRPQRRPIELAQRVAVAKYGQHFGSFHKKICTYDPCPLVQGDVLIYRDEAHLTATFARRLTPAARTMLRGLLATRARR